MKAISFNVLFFCMLLASCSFKISHADGSVTYLGAVNIREGNAGDAPLVHSRRYGVMMDAGVQNNGFAIGYDDRLIVIPATDAVTRVDYSPGHGDPKFSSEISQ